MRSSIGHQLVQFSHARRSTCTLRCRFRAAFARHHRLSLTQCHRHQYRVLPYPQHSPPIRPHHLPRRPPTAAHPSSSTTLTEAPLRSASAIGHAQSESGGFAARANISREQHGTDSPHTVIEAHHTPQLACLLAHSRIQGRHQSRMTSRMSASRCVSP